MLEKYKWSSSLGIGLGLLLAGGGLALAWLPEHAGLALLLLVSGFPVLVWGCGQYATAKGHSNSWGLLGLTHVLGVLLLALLPDKRRSGPAFGPSEEAYLFPSDERRIPALADDMPDDEALHRGEFAVTFGRGVTSDGFGFVRRGTIRIQGDSLVCEGQRNWSAQARFGVFLLISVLPAALFHIRIGFLPALLVVHFLCGGPGRLVLAVRAVRGVERGGKKLCFYAEDPESRARRMCVWRLDSEDEAMACERALTREHLARAA